MSLDPYRRESLKILALFKEMAPRGEIEKASIDEAFLDLTPMVIERLLIAHSYLGVVPEDAPEGLDSPLPRAPPIDWTKAGNVFPIDGVDADAASQEDKRSEDGEGNDEQTEKAKEGATWGDWALCTGAEIMGELREAVWTRMHYTCSAVSYLCIARAQLIWQGIAHNKAMAKVCLAAFRVSRLMRRSSQLCSAWKKPNNQTVLRMSATPSFLRNMDFTDVRVLSFHYCKR